MEKTKCMHCGSEIYIAKIFSDSTIPINCDPEIVQKPGKYISLEKGYIPMDIGEKHYIVHSMTCPKAKEVARQRYQKKKYEEAILEPILLTDLAGMMLLLDKCKTLKSLSERWLEQSYQISMSKLDPKDKEKLIAHKDKLKLVLQPVELEFK